ncbi:MAG TPA: sugar phosphate isomerase/epimerase family protein [Patescibacteria group bacterium]|nr:sugar phosphate isomerase/epimerase family protein [Patescibacteria group bacterium]
MLTLFQFLGFTYIGPAFTPLLNLMNQHDLTQRLGVCSWSLQPIDLRDLIAKVKATGIRRLQLALDPLRESPAQWQDLPDLFAKESISILSGMFGCAGEDYSTLESIRLTGGIAPDVTWERNWKHIQATAALAQSLGLKLVTFHAGFLPHDDRDQNFPKMIQRLNEVADIFDRAHIAVGLETGQETADVLASVLQKLNRRNIGVNFDPANMILYDKGDPIQALQLLGQWIRQVHIKDATRTKVSGTWGEEVPAGTGEVVWTKFFAALKKLNFSGPIVIEREAGTKRIEDIRRAKEVVEGAFA